MNVIKKFILRIIDWVTERKRVRGFEFVKRGIEGSYFRLPRRSTKGSAGYDFFLPVDICIPQGECVTVKTNIKVYMQPGEVLLLFPRSSVGNKRHIMLANTVGVIDSDYYNNPDNEGNISAKLYNYGPGTTSMQKGDKFMQGVFVPFYTTDDDYVTEERVGGTGSTGA